MGFPAALVAAALWGTSGVFVKLIVSSMEISALALAFWRDLVAFILLLVGVRLLRPELLAFRRQDWVLVTGLGISLGGFHACWNLGVMLNGAAVATVQQAAMPAIVAVAAWVVWRESLTWLNGVAILLTFGGTVLVSGPDVLSRAEIAWSGLLLGVGIPLLYAGWNLFGKQLRRRYHPLTVLTYGFGVGAAILLPFQFNAPQPWPFPWQVGISFAGLIVLPTILGFTVYTFALGRLPASVATILAMSEIAFVAVYAYLLLGERLTAGQVMGSLLVVAGVILLIRRQEPLAA